MEFLILIVESKRQRRVAGYRQKNDPKVRLCTLHKRREAEAEAEAGSGQPIIKKKIFFMLA